MIGDFMTKPNQGALFTKFRDQIMGVTPAKSPGPGKVKDGNFFTHKSLAKRGKLAHRSVLDEDRKRTEVGQRTDGIGPRKNLGSKNNPKKTYALQ